MTENQLIDKIKGLKSIKPDSDWVSLTKSQIFSTEEIDKPSLLNSSLLNFGWIFGHKLAFATLGVFAIFIGVFGFAQTSVPGDSLFTLKKIAEQSQTFFVSAKDQPSHNLALANKRLDDLTRIAEGNDVDKLAPAINEYKESVKSVKKAVEGLANTENSGILNQLAELGQKEQQMKSLGVEIGQDDGLDSVFADIVGKEILLMDEKEELTEAEVEFLNNLKSEYEQGNYSKALEILLLK